MIAHIIFNVVPGTEIYVQLTATEYEEYIGSSNDEGVLKSDLTGLLYKVHHKSYTHNKTVWRTFWNKWMGEENWEKKVKKKLDAFVEYYINSMKSKNATEQMAQSINTGLQQKVQSIVKEKEPQEIPLPQKKSEKLIL